MTITIRKTAKGSIFTSDGYSTFYGAFVQGARTFEVFVPAALVEFFGLDDTNIFDYVRCVPEYRQHTDLAKGVKFYKSGIIQ